MTKRDLVRISTLAVVVALWSAIAPPPTRADLSVYVTGSGNEFGTLDLTTGAFSQIATLALPAGDAIYGMGFGANGMLYGVDSEPNANLWQINPSNGAVTELGAIGQSAAGATSDASGTLYVISQDVNGIYSTLNPPSTSPNVVGPTGISSGGLMAVSADGSQLFTTTPSMTSSTWDLVSLNPSTGAASIVGDTSYTPDTGLFVGNTLYGFDTTYDTIVTLNTTTGAGTQVATYSLPNGDVIVSAAAIPEPSSLVLGAIGTVVACSVGLIRHRRRN
jgi:hypothetical protein